ncbi:hypothetical protein [Falsigemmobacter faecalis]|uniref:DUF2946 domain-containing protein n=1 Tax=Falsigemmobacter faecalis TaxID=2488730 RepID=A0A3P3DU72_9RHOB|nr:hypothetical protein [Falsigemmobacter faecalis]RRH77296.1 hypothetical protein EG244_03630 [Falsigemmobacter faecalis]
MMLLPRLRRLVPLLALPALLLALMAGPRHVAPSLMELQIAEALLAGAAPEDLCGMEDGSAAPCHACLPQTVWTLQGPAAVFSAPPLRLLAVVEVRPSLREVALRATGPGAIRAPPGDFRTI